MYLNTLLIIYIYIYIMFYGQFYEDKYLSQFFDDNYIGVCIDVGAYDGINGSNTYYFEKKGWKTLCIEPIPESFNKCNSIREHTINCCVSNYDKDNVEFNIVRLHGDNVSAISSLEIDERLIDSHKHLINTIEKINVKVKSLDTILKEYNISKNIDFISIDTENTEIDVLKGIDFNTYNINFLIIENNFNESIIENFLLLKNFTKIHRLAVNDFYVNNNYLKVKLLDCFEIVSSNYYSYEGDTLGNVTALVNILARRYMSNYNNNIIISNDIFTDTRSNIHKLLFITIQDKNTKQLFKFDFKENSLLDFDFIYNKLKQHKPSYNLIEVSIGEIIDKYSILELKCKYISDKHKLDDIKVEMNILETIVADVKSSQFYKMLLYINEQIWLDTDIIKSLNIDDKEYQNVYNFTKISKQIFDNNQKRFRLKNHFNTIKNSTIKEHKSYTTNSCFIDILEETEIYSKIAEINYLCISYDTIYFNIAYKNIICKLFKNANIYFIEDIDANIYNYSEKCILQNYIIDKELQSIFEFEPIKYKSGGKLGDFLNQLSVVCENYYNTGKKGELYIFDMENPLDQFIFGIEQTYTDTYDAIISQPFIKSYKIYNNETIDINLSSWRNNFVFSRQNNWIQIYKNNYNIDWGSHKWLSGIVDFNWDNKIIINITPCRFISTSCLAKLIAFIKDNIDNCIFVSNEIEHYNYFCEKTKLNVAYYTPKNFTEIVTIINSCKIGYFGFSSMAVLANALHKNHYMIGTYGFAYYLNDIKDIMPHVLDIFI